MKRNRFTTIALLSLFLLAPLPAVAAESDPLVDVTFRGVTLQVHMPSLKPFRLLTVDVDPCKLPPARFVTLIQKVLPVCEVETG